MPLGVMLVDDVEEVRVVIRQSLRLRGGFDVVGEAADGRSAVELAQRCRPDVIVLDLGLPDLAGRDVLALLRQAVPAAHIVVFTGTETSDRAVLRTEADGFVLKDEDVAYLVDLLEHLGRRGPRSAVFRVENSTDEIAKARRFLATRCQRWGCDAELDDALVVASELVTNALLHARSGCELRVQLDEQALRLDVVDGGRGSPDLRRPDIGDEHGRGLLIVSALCAAWGVETLPDGRKVVWAEVPRRSATASGPG